MKNWIKYLSSCGKESQNLLSKCVILFVRVYQILISPFLLSECRFTPTCSQYAKSAYEQKSFLKATSLVCRRIFSCQPFGRSGYDPVPNE